MNSKYKLFRIGQSPSSSVGKMLVGVLLVQIQRRIHGSSLGYFFVPKTGRFFYFFETDLEEV